MFYYESGNVSDDYNSPITIPSNRRARDADIDPENFPFSAQSAHSSSSQQQHPQFQHTTGNNAIYCQYDDDMDSQQPHFSQDTPYSLPGQDVYMKDFYKDMPTWDNSNSSKGAQNQLLCFFDSKPQQDVDMLLSLGQQDILLSDPNFVRQQQLLQEQQRETLQREAQQEYIDDADALHAFALFDEFDDTIGFHHHHQGPSLGINDDHIYLSYPPTTPAPELKHQVLPKPIETPKDSAARRSMAGTVASAKLKRISNPIPISSSYNAGDGRLSEIDHQRRQNELQARFRVNYNKKSGINGSGCNSNPSHQETPSVPANLSTSASTLSQQALTTAAFGSSVPTLPSGRIDNEAGFPAGRSPHQGGQDIEDRAMSFPSRTMPIQIHRVQRGANATPFDAEQHQRQLDGQLEKVDFNDITVSELKEMLRQRGKPATGKKVILIQRLQEERDLIKTDRNGKTHRHSQPPPASSRHNESVRPRSYQGSSPMIIHAMPKSPLMGGGDSALSMPNASLMNPGSPNSVTMSLNRSIANMHIGSPPLLGQHSRRYSPYATPGSPRVGSSSPIAQNVSYSSSVPNNDPLSSSSPSNNLDLYGLQFSSSYTNRYRPYNAYGRTKNYAPFTSSALATPDRDDDRNPFDDYTAEQGNSLASSSAISPGPSEPKIDSVLYGGNNAAFDLDIPEGFTEEDIIAILAEKGLGMDLHNAGYSSNDKASFDHHFPPTMPR